MKPISQKPVHKCFETLANELRLNIIKTLKKDELCVTDLAEKLGVERSRVSHSLQTLKRCSIVHSKNKGKKNIYYLDKRVKKRLKTQTILKALGGYMDECCPLYGGKND
ncbi:MAG: metalloregulator ArsR/SmtB family transcription factor [Candidatus Undinarchaeales archaeon]